MYGCKKIGTAGIKKYRPLAVAGHRFIIEVPKRKSGMSGFGKAHECHTNCQAFMYKVGGKILRGYAIQEEEDCIKFMFHSVWVSPEGKASCITRYDEDDPDFIKFIPLYETTTDGWKIDLPDLMLKTPSSKLKPPKLSWYFAVPDCLQRKMQMCRAPKSLTRKSIETATSKLLGLPVQQLKEKMISKSVIWDTLDHAGFYPPSDTKSWEIMKERITDKYCSDA